MGLSNKLKKRDLGDEESDSFIDELKGRWVQAKDKDQWINTVSVPMSWRRQRVCTEEIKVQHFCTDELKESEYLSRRSDGSACMCTHFIQMIYLLFIFFLFFFLEFINSINEILQKIADNVGVETYLQIRKLAAKMSQGRAKVRHVCTNPLN